MFKALVKPQAPMIAPTLFLDALHYLGVRLSVLPSHDAMGEIWEFSLPPTFCEHGPVETSLEFTPGNSSGPSDKKTG